ncbi:MAG: enoyl-CoA hydratase-related protein [Thermodesulfobacteriota bacterium]|nr:enoyl-CoA hydratase-related protein [Thermodesulfobacteriota bacterium]
MGFEEILFEKRDGVATVTLNRPDRLNAFTTGMYQRLAEILDEIKKDDELAVMVVTGAGKGFCAGSDVSDRLARRMEKGSEESRFESLKQIGAVALDLEDFDKPIIAAVNGVAVGAGLSVALAGDIRIASEKARFGAVWVRVGLIPDLGATYSLPRVVGMDKAMEMTLTGDLVNAEEALKIGLVSRVLKHDELMPRAGELAARIAEGPAIAIELTKRGLRRSLNNDLKSQLDYESYAQNICRYSTDHKEGVQAFIEKRKPEFRGR